MKLRIQVQVCIRVSSGHIVSGHCLLLLPVVRGPPKLSAWPGLATPNAQHHSPASIWPLSPKIL
jgi:hypothetical protein